MTVIEPRGVNIGRSVAPRRRRARASGRVGDQASAAAGPGSSTWNVVPDESDEATRDPAAVGLDQAAGDRQAQARSAATSRRLAKRSKTCGQEGRVDPGPGVATTISARPSRRSRSPARSIVPPAGGVWRRAFATRFAMTSRMRTGSTSMIGRSAGASVVARPRPPRPPAAKDRRDIAERAGRGRSARGGAAASRPPTGRPSEGRRRAARGRVSRRGSGRGAPSSAGWTPSRIASTLPWITASGVRSSWLTSASSVRRCSSSASSRAAIVLKPRASSRTGRAAATGLGDPDGVVAVLDPARRVDQLVEGAAGRRTSRPQPATATSRTIARRGRPDDLAERARAATITRAARRGDDADDPTRKTSAEQAAEPAATDRPRRARPGGRHAGARRSPAGPPAGHHGGRGARGPAAAVGPRPAGPPRGPGGPRRRSRALVREAVADAVDRQDVARAGAGRARACAGCS